MKKKRESLRNHVSGFCSFSSIALTYLMWQDGITKERWVKEAQYVEIALATALPIMAWCQEGHQGHNESTAVYIPGSQKL